ncbi:MAG: hypothetical protein AB7K68_10170 [Bacteriovoracia bacterium]
MRSFLLLALFAAIPAMAKVPYPSDIKVSTEFSYNDVDRTTEASTSSVFDRANHGWKTIFRHGNGIQVQARVISSSQKDVRMEYQVIDAKNNNEVLSSPAFIALFGEKAGMETQDRNGAKVKISLLANPVK